MTASVGNVRRRAILASSDPKTCKTCNVVKTVGDFPYAGSSIYRRTVCRPCYNESQRIKGQARYVSNKEKYKAAQGRYRLLRKRGIPGHPRMGPEEYFQKRRDDYQRFKKSIKSQTFTAYGGAMCACCGETIVGFLTLDHINNNGAESRRELKVKGMHYYAKLKSLGYPPGYQVLCYNCNAGRHRNGGVCPHQCH